MKTSYKVPAADPSAQFVFELDGQAHTVPLIEDLPLDRIDALNALRGMSMSSLSIRELLTALFGDDAGTACLKLTARQLAGLVEAWEGASATTVGESEPSGS